MTDPLTLGGFDSLDNSRHCPLSPESGSWKDRKGPNRRIFASRLVNQSHTEVRELDNSGRLKMINALTENMAEKNARESH